jgi:peptidoglycan/xylan/chitin deacetylase (PgdA/CDA1 family)
MTTVCLSFDFDAASIWVSTFKLTSAGPLSRGEYSARVGVERVLAMLSEARVPATFFIPAHSAHSFPEQAAKIRDGGYEIGVHGYCHESPVGLSMDEETSLFKRSIAKLKSVLGASFTPVGYRSPASDLSSNTIGILEDFGLLYDSSMCADDFTPYRARRGDQISEEAFIPGQPTSIIELPFNWELDDFPYFQFLNRPLYSGLRPADEVYHVWKEEFDYCHREVKDGLFTLTMHPEIIGRGPRIQMLARLVEYMRSNTGVRFATLADEAKRRQPLL